MEDIVFQVEKFSSNPYYQKWKRGRPSEDQRKKRALSEAWNKKHIELYPELYTSFDLLLNSETPRFGCDGKVKIVYGQRKISH